MSHRKRETRARDLERDPPKLNKSSQDRSHKSTEIAGAVADVARSNGGSRLRTHTPSRARHTHTQAVSPGKNSQKVSRRRRGSRLGLELLAVA